MDDLDIDPNSFCLETELLQSPDNNFLLSFADISEHAKSTDSDIYTFTELQNFSLSPFVDQSWRDGTQNSVETSDKSSSVCSGSPSVVIEDPESSQLDDYTTTDQTDKKRVRGKNGTVSKLPTRTLQYPPCYVCRGKASGEHYGVNSCEACKGFFRRYILRKKGAYECKSGGNCEVAHGKKGMCSGCRLQKCLNVGMSKERCKLGRYSAEKRTEKIRTVKEMKNGISFVDTDFSVVTDRNAELDPDSDLITKTLAGMTISSHPEETFSDDIIPALIKAKDNMRPYGKNIRVNNTDEIQQALKDYHEEFNLKRELYGEMGPVPKEEFVKLYQTYGIDVDNRLKDVRECLVELDVDIYDVCNFAKHVPFFSKLCLSDQSNLMKVSFFEMLSILCCKGYDHELGIYLDKKAFHVSEMGKIVSREYVQEFISCTLKCQKLQLTESEQVLLMAMCLFFTDRCFLENPGLVDKIQLSLTQLLRQHIERNNPGTSRKRFTDIVDFLIYARTFFEMDLKEIGEVCKDEIYGNEFPILKDFFPKEISDQTTLTIYELPRSYCSGVSNKGK